MGDWGGVLEGAHEGPWAPREEVGILVMGVVLIDLQQMIELEGTKWHMRVTC